MQGRKGEKPENVRVYDTKERLLIDKELTEQTIDFMKRQKAAGKPFFAFVPYTQPHMPTLPHPDFKGKSGNGPWADVLMQIDGYVGRLLDTVDELGVRENTIFIFTSDNGPEFARAWIGSPAHGAAPISRGWKLRCACRSSSVGRAKFPPERSTTKSSMRWTSSRPSPASLAAKCRPTASSTAWIRRDFLLGKQQKSNREASSSMSAMISTA